MQAAIKTILEEIPIQAPNLVGNTAWTKYLKERLSQLGRENKYYVCASGVSQPPAHHGEWLFDLTWLDYGEDNEEKSREGWRLKNVPLILESEWAKNTGDLLDDFEKLIFYKADLKVFIFDSPSEAAAQSRFDRLFRARKCISEADGAYLLCCYAKNEHGQWKAIFK